MYDDASLLTDSLIEDKERVDNPLVIPNAQCLYFVVRRSVGQDYWFSIVDYDDIASV